MSTTSEWEILGDAKFRWGTKRGKGGKNKEFQFYGSFSYDGVEYKLYDYVYMYTDRQSYPYVGKLIKSWQNPNESKKVKVQWLFLPSEIRYWLKHHNVNVREKEIFFASGEGKGLVNVCPLEAIAGKCNVVCTSLDCRNPQPSEEQLHMADYVFYRTFDVGSCTISDSFDDKVGFLEVNFVFNQKESEKSTCPKLILGQKEDGGKITIENKVKESMLLVRVEPTTKYENCLLKPDDSGGTDARPSKRVKFENDTMKLEDSNGTNVRNSKRVEHGSSSKNPSSMVNVASKEMPTKKGIVNKLENGYSSDTYKQKRSKSIIESTNKVENYSLLIEKGKGISDKKLAKLDDKKLAKLDDKKLAELDGKNKGKAPKAFDDVDEKKEGKKFDVTRRPYVETGKWFTSLPWKQRLLSAHEKNALILLQNLDPDYTSGEVEDIVWSAFNINCEAKMVQRTLFSSPYSGQALVIFKKKEEALRVIRKLNDGCLMLPNQRPLVGCMVALPKVAGKQTNFPGHLSMDKIKLQMQREMRDALSTSHCSQPNTIEYDLALEWCLLQSRSAFAWNALYKRQEEDLKRVTASSKSN